MTINSGTRLSHYEIFGPIGAGGMGEVYRATDTRLNREVAIKVLPASLAGDADRLRRFKQEALATSALNHPDILTIYDIGTFEASVPRELFQTRVSGLTDSRTHYSITADGQRFLVVTTAEDMTSSPITVVLNWTAELKR